MATILRPLSTSELLDRTFFLYRKHFMLFVGIVALPYMVVLAFQLTTIALGLTGSVFATAGTSLLGAIVSLIALGASQAATVIAVSEVHLERPASIGGSFAAIKGRIFQIAGIMFGVGLGVGIGFLLLVIPGIYLALAWSLAMPVTVLERTGLNATTSRSSALTKGDRGRIFVIYFLVTVLTYIVLVIVQFPLLAAVGIMHPATQQTPAAWVHVLSSVSSFIGISLVGPLLTIALSLIYYDERVRKEGFDLQLMMQTLQSSTAPSIS